jgi:hypothetical protein
MIGFFTAKKNEERENFSLSAKFQSQSINVFDFIVNHEKLLRFFNSSNEKKW